MSGVNRKVTEVLRAYALEEECEPRRIDIGDALEAVQALEPSLKRLKRRPLQDVIEQVLSKLQEEYEQLMTVDHSESNQMNASVVNLWASNEEQPESKRPDKKRRKKAKQGDEAENESKNEHKPASSVLLKDLGGIDDVVTQILELLAMPLAHPEVFMRLGSDIPRGILLHGPPGCGKTVLANAVANELGCAFLNISAPAVVSGMSGESEKKLRELFEEAKASAPCLIFIDEIDAITPKRETAQREMERRIVAQLLTCMDDVALERTGGRPVMIIGATNRPDAIDPALRRGGRFDHEICMPVPDQAARQRILETLAQKLRVDGEMDFVELARRTPGYVGADLNALVAAAGVSAIKRIFKNIANSVSEMPVDGEMANEEQTSVIRRFLDAHPDPLTEEELNPLCITYSDFLEALPQVQPSSKREGFATVPDVTWSDVGAMKPIRQELEYAIVGPIQRPDLYAQAGITAPSGVLLWGPPGCGKTLLAKAVANESQANFISVRGPELLNKYVGESERAVRQVFVRARASVPCVIFFDELDALVPRRDDGQSEASSRVVNTLLTELDGTGDRNGVFVVAATNRPDMIDQAMLRPGRLDKQLFVELPTDNERADILATICANSNTPIQAGFNPQDIALSERCRNFSGADLAALVREAAVIALRRALQTNSIVEVNEADFAAAFDKVRPSVSDSERQRYYDMKLRLS